MLALPALAERAGSLDEILSGIDAMVEELKEGGVTNENSATIENNVEVRASTGGNTGEEETGSSEARVEVRNSVNGEGESKVEIIIEGNGEKKVIEKKIEDADGHAEIINDITVEASEAGVVITEGDSEEEAAALQDINETRDELIQPQGEPGSEAITNTNQPILLTVWEGISETVEHLFLFIINLF